MYNVYHIWFKYDVKEIERERKREKKLIMCAYACVTYARYRFGEECERVH